MMSFPNIVERVEILNTHIIRYRYKNDTVHARKWKIIKKLPRFFSNLISSSLRVFVFCAHCIISLYQYNIYNV